VCPQGLETWTPPIRVQLRYQLSYAPGRFSTERAIHALAGGGRTQSTQQAGFLLVLVVMQEAGNLASQRHRL
jgi:hypothetical protein